MYESGANQGDAFAWVNNTTADLGSALTNLLMAPEIVPGTTPGYQLCKTIYSYHPLGAILTEAPITRAQAKARDISVGVLGEERIVARFNTTWDTIGRIGATKILHNLGKTARIYGIASLGVGEYDKDPSEPLELDKIADANIFFNILDPLNTAGSLVLNQDPNAPDFLKPSDVVTVNGKCWHISRLFVKMNEDPLYIEFTTSAFGFVGRSVYQRALFPLKTFVQSMVTDQMVTQKAGLLVYKAMTPGSIIDNIMKWMMGIKRGAIKQGVTNQVLSIGNEENIETLNMMNLDKAADFARRNCIKNIASAVGMPASIIAQETLTEGFGEGTEDAKKETEYLEYIRQDLQPGYDFMDRIIMRKAWTREFYESLFEQYPEYAKVDYETALHEWIREFKAAWPNLLIEPDSEKSKTQDVQFKAVVAMVETIGPELDPINKAKLLAWAAENANEREELFASKLDLDTDELEDFLAENREVAMESQKEQEEPGKPRPFSAAS